MKRLIALSLSVILLAAPLASEALAAVNVTRSGDENPMKEVAKSIIYGGLAGLTLGLAFAWATEGDDSDGDIIRWTFVGGTMAGLGMGIYWVTKRPQPVAALEFENGHVRAAVPAVALDRDGAARVHLARVRF